MEESTRFRSKNFDGFHDTQITRAYDEYWSIFEDRANSLSRFQGPALENDEGGLANLFSNVGGDVVLAGPFSLEIWQNPKWKKGYLGKRFLHKKHSVLLSNEFETLMKSGKVVRLFLQILSPSHTSFILIEGGKTYWLNNYSWEFGWKPEDFTSFLQKIMPWEIILPKGAPREFHPFAYSFNPKNISASCSLITMACIKRLMILKNFSAWVDDVSAVPVKRHPETKSISLTRIKKHAWREWHFTNLVREAYDYFIDTGILKMSNFKLTKIERAMNKKK